MTSPIGRHAEPGKPREVISIGEAKWGEVMGTRHLARLRRAQALLQGKGLNTSQTVLACYSGAGFDDELRGQSGPDVLLADLSALYR